MNAQVAMAQFDNALSVMAQAAKLTARADTLTRENSAFGNFEALLNAKGQYRPSLTRTSPDTRELGALYDAAQMSRGDDRRAFMHGTPARKGSIIDRANWDKVESYYAQGDRRAFWDRYTKQWIAYTVCSKGYQDGCADFYPNAPALLMGEHAHA